MAEETQFCLRVRYVERGRLRYLSHLELLRALERTIRRSGLPYAVTQGFSPRIKAAYGPALPVGVASDDEWFDLWLRALRPSGEYLEALRRAAPPDLQPQEAAYVDVRSLSLSAALTLASWEFELTPWPQAPSGVSDALTADAVGRAFGEVMARGSIEYLRTGKMRSVPLDGKIARGPQIEDMRADGVRGVRLSLTTRSSDAGALRPDVLMDAVFARLAESSAARGESAPAQGEPVVSFKRYLRTSIVRTAQYLEGEDGTWVRPI